ncbi:MAG: hypothetical protein HYR91_08360 [Flavobacteriia bacterium]|nr:hypothetical protein [Flavobacteriia bacterium]
MLAQNTDQEKELVRILESQKPISTNLFVDPNIIHPMTLVSTINWRKVWNDKDDSLKFISQFYDVRLKFESNNEAIQFHKDYLKLNSENGIKHKHHGIKFEGANNFYVFDASEQINKMMNMVGMRAYCFLFVVDNYVIKLYLTCNIDSKPAKFQKLITEAISKIKTIKS